MTTTNFVNGITLTDAGWFNDADAAYYEGTFPSGPTALVVTGATTLAVFNTVATTVNAFGAASTALNIGNVAAGAKFPGAVRKDGTDGATLDATPRTIYTLLADTMAIYLITASCEEDSGKYSIAIVVTTGGNSRTLATLSSAGMTFTLSGADIQWVAPAGALTSRFTILRLR